MRQSRVIRNSSLSQTAPRRGARMRLSERLSEYVRAGFTGICIQSHEHEDALVEIAGLARQESWQLAVWDIDQGLSFPATRSNGAVAGGGNDPLAAIRALSTLATSDSSALLVVRNLHRF